MQKSNPQNKPFVEFKEITAFTQSAAILKSVDLCDCCKAAVEKSDYVLINDNHSNLQISLANNNKKVDMNEWKRFDLSPNKWNDEDNNQTEQAVRDSWEQLADNPTVEKPKNKKKKNKKKSHK